jgi:lipopolysaccharide export system permease protein
MLKPVMLTTFIFCLFTFVVNDKFVPPTIEKANRVRQEELETGHSNVKGKKDVALYGEGGLLIFARSFDPEKQQLRNVIIHSQGPEGRSVIKKISARTVTWDAEEGWAGRDVVVFEVDENGDFAGDPRVYDSAGINIKEQPEDFIRNQWDPRFMSYRQLRDYLHVFKNASPMTKRRLRVDLNYKLALPFTALITVLIGVPFSIETGRASALLGMAKGITAGILYLPFMAFSLALGKGGVLPPVFSAWATNVLFAFAGVYFIYRKS